MSEQTQPPVTNLTCSRCSYLGVLWASDVLGGWALGAGVLRPGLVGALDGPPAAEQAHGRAGTFSGEGSQAM